ncbi:TRADD-N-associated membrane domain-containing protein [Bacillus thuringiensis]|uniref:TRADD-N-associated membrane domain-containing protein n=1 Tax=Bacillus thuringiensis TaxID=1428 RepID=UPI003BF69126
MNTNPLPTSRRTILKERKIELNQLIIERKNRNRLYLILGILCICALAYLLYVAEAFVKENSFGAFTSPFLLITIMGFTLLGMFCFFYPLMKPSNKYITEFQEIENELNLLSISYSSLEERSETLFKHHHFELKRYYDENLKQSSWIFFVGIVCIVIGFAIIGITLYFLIANSSNELENKLIVASVGAIGAILSNFIAVIYLKMHSETVKSLTEFHNRFVNTQHFYFGNFLLSKIQNEDKREDALVELALKINGISPKAPTQGEESK